MVDSMDQKSPTTPSNNGSISTNANGFKDPRVNLLNDKIGELEKKIDLLTATIESLLRGANPDPSLFVPQSSWSSS
jgi:hypothetical protein